MDFTTISLPAWAVTEEAQAWFYGFAVMCFVRIFRAGLKWFKRAGIERLE